jgi:nitrous oxidase accessory protein
MASLSVAGRIGIDGESEKTTIVNVTVQGFEYGMRFLFVHGSNTVLSSDIINCNNGIYSSYTKDNIIKNNNIQNCSQYGIFLNAGSDSNLIENNVLRGNEYAMRIKGSTLNLLKYNVLRENSKGIYFCCGARNNTVTRNSFYESGDWHASDQYQNIWDLNGVGNYWDDYPGNDLDNDGIGDEVYLITEGYSEDRFPIVDLSILDD